MFGKLSKEIISKMRFSRFVDARQCMSRRRMTRGFQAVFSIVILTSCVSGGSEPSPQRTQATVQEPVQVEEKIKSSAWHLTLTVTDLSGRPISKAEIVMEDGTGDADFRLTDGNGFSHFSTFQGERQVSIQANGYKNFVHRVLLMDDAHLDVVLERDYRSARRGLSLIHI